MSLAQLTERIIDKYYPAGTPLRDIYMRHCGAVAALARALAGRNAIAIDSDDIEAAAMLHDIGIFLTDAPGIQCHGSSPYICHGPLGADLLRGEGAPEWLARVAERHTGAGITHADIVSQRLPLPPGRCYMPATTLERLVCYADKFYSKSGSMQRKSDARALASMEAISPATAERFRALAAEFGPVDSIS